MKNTFSFYQQTWFILLMSILFFPIGLVLIWKYSSWALKQKAGTSFICLFFFVICLANITIVDKYSTASANEEQTNVFIEENKKLKEPAKQYIQHTIDTKTLRVDSATSEKGVIVSMEAIVSSQDEATAFAKDAVAKLSSSPVPIVEYTFTFSTLQGLPICAVFKNSNGFQLQNATDKMNVISFE